MAGTTALVTALKSSLDLIAALLARADEASDIKSVWEVIRPADEFNLKTLKKDKRPLPESDTEPEAAASDSSEAKAPKKPRVRKVPTEIPFEELQEGLIRELTTRGVDRCGVFMYPSCFALNAKVVKREGELVHIEPVGGKTSLDCLQSEVGKLGYNLLKKEEHYCVKVVRGSAHWDSLVSGTEHCMLLQPIAWKLMSKDKSSSSQGITLSLVRVSASESEE